MNSPLPKWGVVSTIKAPLKDILGFAAYHLQMGAHRLYIYLDAPEVDSFAALKAHPKIRVTATDTAYWSKKGGRPDKHQPRQTINAADAYAKRAEVDWLCHIDCDEFLMCDTPLPQQLADLDQSCLCARIRPVEALTWDGPSNAPRPFKGFALPLAERQAITQALYPRFGADVNGGFLSHVAGKMIYRTGVDGLSVKIHNAFLNGVQNPGQQELSKTRLCHLHAADWAHWKAQFQYRLERGAYRAELKPPPGKKSSGQNMHDLLSDLIETGGPSALRAFFDEFGSPTPKLLEGLDKYGLLYWHCLDLDAAIARAFPEHAD